MNKVQNIFKILNNRKKGKITEQKSVLELNESKANINKIDIKEIKSNNKMEIKKPIIKKRKPDVDLMRIISMYAITLHHLLVHGRAIGKYKFKELRLLNILTYWHVSSFALISGIIGYKTNKYSNLLYLWIWTVFYSVGIFLLAKKFRPKWVEKSSIFYQFFPVIFIQYWYFTQYFGMYFFLPIINKGISLLNKSELKMVCTSLLCIFVIYKDLMNPKSDSFRICSGYSVASFLILFITGAYFGKYKIIFNGTINKIIFCFFCICVYISSSLICYYFGVFYYDSVLLLKLKALYIQRINSFPMLAQSFSIILFLMQLKYNKYLGKIILFIGPLTFGVYLIHEHPLVRSYIIRELFNKDPINLSLKAVIKLTIFKAFIVFMICTIIDYFRELLFRLLRIRQFCIFIMNKITQIFEKNLF